MFAAASSFAAGFAGFFESAAVSTGLEAAGAGFAIAGAFADELFAGTGV